VSSPETQPQRTALAWQRTGLGVLGVAALLGHSAVVEGGVLRLVTAGVVALTGLGVLAVLAPARARALGRAPAAAPRAVALATTAVVVAALAAAATLLSR
jgi:putative membrane protein